VIGALKQSLQSALQRVTPGMARVRSTFSHGVQEKEAGARLSRAAAGWDWRQSPANPGFAESAPPDIGDLALIWRTLAADTRAMRRRRRSIAMRLSAPRGRNPR